MRYGLVSDVHGNLRALEAALAALEQEGAERIICAGDIVGYGPRPNECVATIASLDPAPLVVAGNHDLMATGAIPADGIAPLAAETLEWTREVLSDDAFSYLEALPRAVVTDEQVVVTHGSLDDPTEYVFDGAAARAQLAALAERHPRARGLIIGHTHRPAMFTEEGAQETSGRVDLSERWLLNSGSVGQSRERRAFAQALLLDLERSSAQFLVLDYDVDATRRELRDAGLPEYACHMAPGRAGRVRRKLRSLQQPRRPSLSPSLQ
jgi:predicted phosphodiesterase